MALRFHLFLPARGYGSYVTVSEMGADSQCPTTGPARLVTTNQGNDDSFVDKHRVEVNFDMVEIAIWMEKAETLLARMKDRLGKFSGPTTEEERRTAQDRHPIMVKFFAKFGNRTGARKLQDLRESCKEFAWRVHSNFVPASTIANVLLYFYFWRDQRNHRQPAALTFVRQAPGAELETGHRHEQPETPTRQGVSRQSGCEASVHRHPTGGTCRLNMVIEATESLPTSVRQALCRQLDGGARDTTPPALARGAPHVPQPIRSTPIRPPPGLDPAYRYTYCEKLDHGLGEPHQTYVGWYLTTPQADTHYGEASLHRAPSDSVSMTTASR